MSGSRLRGFEAERCGDFAPVEGLGVGVPGDAPASAWSPAGGYLAVGAPMVDRVGGDAEFGGGLFDTDLAFLDRDGPGSVDGVGVADAGDTTFAPPVTAAGAQPGVVEDLSELFAGVGGAVTADQFECGGGSASGSDPVAALAEVVHASSVAV